MDRYRSKIELVCDAESEADFNDVLDRITKAQVGRRRNVELYRHGYTLERLVGDTWERTDG